MGWKTKLHRAKQLHRPSLKDWECDELYKEYNFPKFVQQLQQQQPQPQREGVTDEAENNLPSLPLTTAAIRTTVDNHSNGSCCKDGAVAPSVESSSVSSTSSSNSSLLSNGVPSIATVPIIGNTNTRTTTTSLQLPVILDAKSLTTHEFHAKYESRNIPCIIRNIPAGYENATYTGQPWRATRQWIQYVPLRDDEYHRNTPLRERLFKCGEDDSGKSIKVRLKYFLKYMYHNKDDSPLYIFDMSFENDVHAKSLLHDYVVPCYFKNDLFNYISESRRPPYRWILIGPQRSGSCIHIDPLCTNAWNTLLHGQKRWVLFPPCVPKYIVKGKGLIGPKEDDEAIHYFMYILPRIKDRAQQVLQQQPNHFDYTNFACYEFTQQAGETVFVPHGWWHAVLNITHTIGVTQNYASACNFTNVWYKVRKDRPRMAVKLLVQLQQYEPQLYEQAIRLNQQDHFRMKYDPMVQQQQERNNHKKRNKKQRQSV